MAWNKPSEGDRAVSTKPPLQRGRIRRPAVRGLVAGAIVVVGAGVAAWWLWPGTTPPPSDPVPAAASPIEEVKPVAAKAKPVVAAKEPEDRNSLEWLKKHDKRYFVPTDAVRRANGRLYTKEGRRILERLPDRKIDTAKGYKRIFNHQAECLIERLLRIEPGMPFFGAINYGPKFVESFKASLVSPTLITHEDDAATREMKRQVNEVKADLKARMDAGEDLAQIMRDAEKDLRSLATYRQSMQKELAALRFDENVSEQDYADYVEAANTMLKERGLREITSSKFVTGQLKYLRERHKAATAARAAREASGNEQKQEISQ